MLWKNFLRNYRSNRAPLYLNLHSPFLNTQYQLEAMDEFIQKMVTIDDVYVVTVTQALQWQMNPTPLSQLKNFQSFQCPSFESDAENKKQCQFTYKHKTAPGVKNSTGEYELTTRLPSTNSNTEGPRKSKIFSPKTVHQSKLKHSPQKTTSPSPSSNDEQQGEADKGEEAVNTHDENEVDEPSSIRHHHNYKTHKPWFLKSVAVSSSQSCTLLCLALAFFHLTYETFNNMS